MFVSITEKLEKFYGYIYNLKILPYPPVVFRLWIMHLLFR